MAVIDPRLSGTSTPGRSGVVSQRQALAPAVASPFADKPSHPGGWKGFVTDILDNPIVKYGVLKPLEVLDTGRRAVISGVREVADTLDGNPNTHASWGDFISQASDTSFGFGKAFHFNTGNKWLDRAIGFVGDVGLDPLTYASFGGHALLKGVEGGDAAIHIAGEEGRRALASRVYKLSVDAGESVTAAGSKAARVAREGVTAARDLLTVEQQASAGLAKSGMYFFGKRLPAVRVPMTGMLGELVEGGSSRVRLMASSTKVGGWMQEKTMKGVYQELQLKLARGEVAPEKVYQHLVQIQAVDSAKVAVGAAKVEVQDLIKKAMTESRIGSKTEMVDKLHVLLEEPAQFAAASPAMQQAAGAWKQFFEKLHANTTAALTAVDPSLVPKEITNYFPHMLTKDGMDFVRGSTKTAERLRAALGIDITDPESFLHPRKLKVGAEFFNAGSLANTDLTVGRLNAIAAEGGFAGKFFEENIGKVVDSYSHMYASQMGKIAAHQHLLDSGVFQTVEKQMTFDPTAMASAAKEHATAAGAHIEAQQGAADAARKAADALVTFHANVGEQLGATLDKKLGMATERVKNVDAAKLQLRSAIDGVRSASDELAKQQGVLNTLADQGSLLHETFAKAHEQTMNDMESLISELEHQYSSASAAAGSALAMKQESATRLKDLEYSLRQRVKVASESVALQGWLGDNLLKIADGSAVLPKTLKDYQRTVDFIAESINPKVQRAANQASAGAAIPGSVENWLAQSVRSGRLEGASATDKFVADLFGADAKLGHLQGVSRARLDGGLQDALGYTHDMQESYTSAAAHVALVLKHYGTVDAIPAELKRTWDGAVQAVEHMKQLHAFDVAVAKAPAKEPEWYSAQIAKWSDLNAELGHDYQRLTDLHGEADALRTQRLDAYEALQHAKDNNLATTAAVRRMEYDRLSEELKRVNNSIHRLADAEYEVRQTVDRTTEGVATAERVRLGDAMQSDVMSMQWGVDRASALRTVEGTTTGRDNLINDLRARIEQIGNGGGLGDPKLYGVTDAPAVATKVANLEGAQTAATVGSAAAGTRRAIASPSVRLLGATAADERRAAMQAVEEFRMTSEVVQEWGRMADKMHSVGLTPSEKMLDAVVDKVRINRAKAWDATVARAEKAVSVRASELDRAAQVIADKGGELSTAEYRRLAADVAKSAGESRDSYATMVASKDAELTAIIRTGKTDEAKAARSAREKLWSDAGEWYKRNHPSAKFQNGRVPRARLSAAVDAAGIDVKDSASWQRFQADLVGRAEGEANYAGKMRRRVSTNLGDVDASGQLSVYDGMFQRQFTPSVKLAAEEHRLGQLRELDALQRTAQGRVAALTGKIETTQTKAAAQLAGNLATADVPARETAVAALWKQTLKAQDIAAKLKGNDLYTQAQRRIDIARMLDSLAGSDGWKLTESDWSSIGLLPPPPFDPDVQRQLTTIIEGAKRQGQDLFVADGSAAGGYRAVSGPMDVRPGDQLLLKTQSEQWVPLGLAEGQVNVPRPQGEGPFMPRPQRNQPPAEAFQRLDPHEADRADLIARADRVTAKRVEVERQIAAASTPRMAAAKQRLAAGAWSGKVRLGTTTDALLSADEAKFYAEQELLAATKEANLGDLYGRLRKVKQIEDSIAAGWRQQAEALPYANKLVDSNYRMAFTRDATGRATTLQGWEQRTVQDVYEAVFSHPSPPTGGSTFSEAEWESLFINPKEQKDFQTWQSWVDRQQSQVESLRNQKAALDGPRPMKVEGVDSPEMLAARLDSQIAEKEALLAKFRVAADSRNPQVAGGAWAKAEGLYSGLVSIKGYDGSGLPDLGNLHNLGITSDHVAADAANVEWRRQSLREATDGSKAGAYARKVSAADQSVTDLAARHAIASGDVGLLVHDAELSAQRMTESVVPGLTAESQRVMDAVAAASDKVGVDIPPAPTFTGNGAVDRANFDAWIAKVQAGTAKETGRTTKAAEVVSKSVGKQRSADIGNLNDAPKGISRMVDANIVDVARDDLSRAQVQATQAAAAASSVKGDLSYAWKMLGSEIKRSEAETGAATAALDTRIEQQLQQAIGAEAWVNVADVQATKARSAFDAAQAVSPLHAATQQREAMLRANIEELRQVIEADPAAFGASAETRSLNRTYQQMLTTVGPSTMDATMPQETAALRATLQASLNAEAHLYRSGAALKASEEAMYNAEYLSAKLMPMVKDGFKTLEGWGLPGIQTSKDVFEFYNNLARVEQPAFAQEMSKFLGWYTKRFKAYATASPGFHVRNALSNTFSSLSAGAEIGNMWKAEKMFQGWFSARNGNTLDVFVKSLGKDAEDFQRALSVYHALGGGQQVSAIDELLKDGKKFIDNNWWLNANRKAAERIEGSARFMLAYDSVKKGMNFEGSLGRVRRYLFDYSPDMRSQLDHNMAQIVPFWTWMSRNLPLQLVNRWTNPRAYAIYNSLVRNVANGDSSHAPGWLQAAGGIRLGPGTFLAPDMPQNRVTDQITQLADPGRLASNLNPILRVPFELLGGRKLYNNTKFSGKPQQIVGGPLEPAVEALLGLLGQRRTVNTAGTGMMIGDHATSDKANYALMNLIPLLAQQERLTPSTDYYKNKQLSSVLSWLGIPVRTGVTERQ